MELLKRSGVSRAERVKFRDIKLNFSKEESEEGSLRGAAKQRLVWLFVNLFTVLVASLVISQFDEIIITYVALAAEPKSWTFTLYDN